MIVTLFLSTSAFDLRSIDITRLPERCHRIIKRSSDNLPGGLFMPKSPKRQSAGCRLLSFPAMEGGKKTPPRTARQTFPDNFESRWLPQRAMISTWMGRLRLQQSELFLPPPLLPHFLPLVFLSSFPSLSASLPRRREEASIARSAIIQASLAKGFSLRELLSPRRVYVCVGW